jgi:hypothetical protein
MLYTTKSTENEEQFPFLKHCTAIAKTIRKIRENHNILLQEIGNDIGNGECSIEPNYSVRLVMFCPELWHIYHHQIISATVAWH